MTPAKLKSLQKHDGECAQAQAALEAMAAGLEVVMSDAPVRVGERTLAPGESTILTDGAEIAIGATIRLRIRPGGGTSLAEARAHLHETRGKLWCGLDALGLATIGEAAEAVARRQHLESESKAASARLEGLHAATIDAEAAKAATALAAAEMDAQRRAALVENAPTPATLQEANTLVRETAQELSAAEAAETTTRTDREAAAKNLRRAGDRLTAHRQALHERKRAADGLEAQCRLLIETHGDDAARGPRLVELSGTRTTAATQLAATQRALAELQPEVLERDVARLQRASGQHAAAKSAAEERRAVARGELQRDGTADPHADFAEAQARLDSAREFRETAARKAGAIRLLHRLFRDEQKALAEQFTRPLAMKISGYLECLFGAGARAEVTLEENNFKALRLIRPPEGNSAFDFDHLSGGTREQLAAAVRLAMAEVLAGTHDGCLPVVFDDAFAFSDPARVQMLQRMLDLAAARGLQVVVLTCNPADYAALGAKQITLRVERTTVVQPESDTPHEAAAHRFAPQD